MERVETRLEQRDYQSLLAAMSQSGVGMAPFIRQAVIEKLDREHYLQAVSVQVDALETWGARLLHELTQARASLAEDHRQHQDALRAELAESARRNEQLIRSFLVALQQSLNQDPPSPTSSAPAPWSPLPTTG